MIVDPFDKSYNPGKLVHAGTPYAYSIKKGMERTLYCLEKEGKLLLEMMPIEKLV